MDSVDRERDFPIETSVISFFRGFPLSSTSHNNGKPFVANGCPENWIPAARTLPREIVPDAGPSPHAGKEQCGAFLRLDNLL